MHRCCFVVLLWLMSACQTLRPPNTVATLQAEGQGYVATATAVRDLAAIQETRVLATADAASTRVMDIQRTNQQLLATVRAGDSQSAVPISVNPAPEMDEASSVQYIVTGTASSVSEADGCVEMPETQFAIDVPRVYVTLHAYNVLAGTRLEAVWSYEGNEVLRDPWTVPQSEADFCIWFFIDPTLVRFQAGNWSVQLYADGTAIGTTSPFQMRES